MTGRRRLAGWTLWTAIILAVIGLISVWPIVDRVTTAKLRREIAALEQAGFAVRPAQLAPPPVPEEENAAPLYLAALEQLPEMEAPPYDNVSSLQPEELEALRQYVQDCSNSFARVRQARERKVCRIERTYADGFAIELPDVSQANRLGRALQARAALEPDAALETVRDLFTLADFYRDEPFLVCQIVRQVFVTQALDVLDRTVTSQTTADELRAWMESLPDAKWCDDMFELGIRGELAMVVGWLGQDSSPPSDPARQRDDAMSRPHAFGPPPKGPRAPINEVPRGKPRGII